MKNAEEIETFTVDEAVTCAASSFFDSINRGGLKTPTEFVFRLTVVCWQVYEEMRGNNDLMAKFIAAENQSLLFFRLMDRTTCHQSVADYGLNNYMCTDGHDLTKLVSQRFFNCRKKILRDSLPAMQIRPTNRRPSAEKLIN